MSTGYHIEVGYNSVHSKEEVAEKLVEVVHAICEEPESIVGNARLVEGAVMPMEYAESYRKPWQDLTIKIIDKDGLPSVMQMASGGGVERGYKEAMRRAFSRLVIQEMHRCGMEVNLIVA